MSLLVHLGSILRYKVVESIRQLRLNRLEKLPSRSAITRLRNIGKKARGTRGDSIPPIRRIYTITPRILI